MKSARGKGIPLSISEKEILDDIIREILTEDKMGLEIYKKRFLWSLHERKPTFLPDIDFEQAKDLYSETRANIGEAGKFWLERMYPDLKE